MPKVTFSIVEEKIAVVKLNDPTTLNAMSEEMADDFASVTTEIKNLKVKPRVIILTGEGKAFSAGGDLTMLFEKSKISKEDNYTRMMQFYGSFLGYRDLRIPTIAVLQGAAVGAGLCVACSADIRIAEKMRGSDLPLQNLAFIREWLQPILPKILGDAGARELLLTGRIINAEESLRRGLVSEILEEGRGLERAQQIAKEILQTGPLVTSQLIGTLDSGGRTLAETLEYEAQAQAENYISEEFLTGITAAREKRKAEF